MNADELHANSGTSGRSLNDAVAMPTPVTVQKPGVNRTALVETEVETALKAALQWTGAAQPNGETLWAEVRLISENVLNEFFVAGMLTGSRPAEAYYVKCDRTTMTQADMDAGQLNVVVGIAPVKPAEFVIVRIGLWTAKP